MHYEYHPETHGTGEQFDPEFEKISPNNKIPAIVDTEGPDGALSRISSVGAIRHLTRCALGSRSGRGGPSSEGQVSKLSMFVCRDEMTTRVEVVGDRGVDRKEALG